MSGFEIFDGDTKMRITEGARTVLTTDGTLINLLSDTISLPFNIVFPDFTKNYLYNWQHVFSYTSLGDSVGYDSGCVVQLTAPKQDFAQETNLVAVPSGADIFIGEITLNRTDAPSHTWNAATIVPLQPMGSPIPLVSGSLLMEAAFGMVRACSVYVSGGQLKLHRQQSVSTPPGGWGAYGNSYNWAAPSSGSGGENVNGGSQGIPILQTATGNVDSYVVSPASNPVGTVPYDERTRRGGPNACPLPNFASYNYGSTYAATLVGSFGRRS